MFRKLNVKMNLKAFLKNFNFLSKPKAKMKKPNLLNQQ